MPRTYEKQYDRYIDEAKSIGFERLGLMSSQSWRADPKHLLFYLSRYKFVSKMFNGLNAVLEVGCGDGFASRIVKQNVSHLSLTDIDPIFIDDLKEREYVSPVDCFVHDFCLGPIENKQYDGIYLLDVLEHIPIEKNDAFLSNIITNLAPTGSLIVGVPSLESQKFASIDSKIGHVNVMSQQELKHKLHEFFYNVFLFSMNDEVVHTGFYGMSHYIFALCTYKRVGFFC